MINHLTVLLARHAIPGTIVSNNGPQYVSAEFAKFPKVWGFTNITNSPKYPQNNRKAEHMVQTTIYLLTKVNDPYETLLA